jgi:hypothetical protein
MGANPSFSTPSAPRSGSSFLAHLLDPDFVGLDDAEPSALLAAQAATTSLFSFDANSEVLGELERQGAQAAFAAVTNPETDDKDKARAILALRAPPAVRHLAGMLSQYDWAFVEQAKELRGYVVAKLLEETKHPDAKVRLRALELTGKLTEVGSFTERISVTKTDATSHEVEDRIRSRLAALLPKTLEVQEAVIVAPAAQFPVPAA